MGVVTSCTWIADRVKGGSILLHLNGRRCKRRSKGIAFYTWIAYRVNKRSKLFTWIADRVSKKNKLFTLIEESRRGVNSTLGDKCISVCVFLDLDKQA